MAVEDASGTVRKEAPLYDLGDPSGTRAVLYTVLGLSAFWELFRYSNYRDLLKYACGSAVCPEWAYISVLTGAFVLSLVFLALPATHVRRTKIARVPGILVISFAPPAVAAVASVCTAAGVGGAFCAVLAVVSLVLFSVAIAILFWVWLRILQDGFDDVRTLVVSAALSAVISFLLTSLEHSVDGGAIAIGFAMAPVGGVCLWLWLADIQGGLGKAAGSGVRGNTSDRGGAPMPGGDAGRAGRASLGRSQKLFLITSAVLFILALSLSGSVNNSQLNPSTDANLNLRHIVTMVELFIFAGYALVCRSSRDLVYLGWLTFAAFFLCGLFLVGRDDAMAASFGVAFSSAGGRCFELLLFVLLLIYRRSSGLGDLVASTFLASEAIAAFFGRGLLPGLYTSMAWDSSEYLGSLTVFLTLGFVLCMLVFLVFELFKQPVATPEAGMEDEGAERVADEAAAQRDGRGDVAQCEAAQDAAQQGGADAIRAVADQFAFSSREESVARLVARGYSAERIAQIEGLSINTVRTHTKNLYRKAGIHSRQELLDMVDEVSSASLGQ